MGVKFTADIFSLPNTTCFDHTSRLCGKKKKYFDMKSSLLFVIKTIVSLQPVVTPHDHVQLPREAPKGGGEKWGGEETAALEFKSEERKGRGLLHSMFSIQPSTEV